MMSRSVVEIHIIVKQCKLALTFYAGIHDIDV